MKVMLAGRAPPQLDQLRFPVLVSPKYDGVRAFVKDGVVWSRNNKPIPNRYVQERFGRASGLDGELIFGPETAGDVFRNTSSVVMSADDKRGAVACFYGFDYTTFPATPFRDRIEFVSRIALKHRGVVLVAHSRCTSAPMVEREESRYLAAGYEGLMIRDPKAHYKFGRSTTAEGYLLKLKRFNDSEAEVTGYEELMHNANEKGVDGKRSTKKSGLVAGGTLGALLVVDKTTKQSFSVGSGFSAKERAELWKQRGTLRGRVITYRYFATGSKDAPRFPVFVGFRGDV